MGLVIFFSHAHHDRAWCERVRDRAEQIGIETYLAEHDVQPGSRLADKVQRAIRRSDAVVVLLTSNSVEAPYVQQEVGYAIACKKLVLPLVHPEVRVERLAMLQGLEYIPFDFADPRPGLEDLTAALSRLMHQQRRQERDAVLVALACLALLVLTSDWGT